MDLKEVFELHAAGRTRVVYHTRDLASVNEAIDEVERGAVDARLVFDLGAGEPGERGAGVLTEERERPAEQPTGEVGEHRGPLPG
jgi:hypothetical protein